jgi:ABC-type branched-subunit amino acid transport system permease subunit
VTGSAVERRIGASVIVAVVLAVALVPAGLRAIGLTDYWLELVVWLLFFAYCAVAWNIIGGFAGQYCGSAARSGCATCH